MNGPHDATETVALQSDLLDERIELVATAREQADVALSVAYHQLLEARDEIDRLRRQVIETKLEYFTREEFAERLKVSVDTVDALVKAKRIPFVRISARLKRFTSVHLAEAARLLEVKPGRDVQSSKSKVHRIGRAA